MEKKSIAQIQATVVFEDKTGIRFALSPLASGLFVKLFGVHLNDDGKVLMRSDEDLKAVLDSLSPVAEEG